MVKEYLKYAIPSAFAMFISALYTVIDGIFVGRGVGDNALAAINIVLPFTVMIIGIANMLAVGGGALVSKNIGLNDTNKAVNIFRQVLKFLMVLSISISLISVIFTDSIVKMLGSTPNLQAMAVEYLRYYAIFSIPNLVGIVLNSFARNDKQPKLAMISTISGAVTNIVLDYVFIFIFDMGIKGAAIATGLGQLVTVAIILPHFINKRGSLTFGNAKLELSVLKNILAIGFPSFLSQISYSFIVLLHNTVIVKNMGEAGIAAYSILNYVGTNIYMILFGLTLGVQPLLSYNYGKKDQKTIMKFHKINLTANLLAATVYVVLILAVGDKIVSVFTTDANVYEIGVIAVIIGSFANYMVGLNVATIVYYQSIEMPKISTIVCLMRSIIFLPLSFMILTKIFGPNGVWAGTLLSEGLSFVSINLIYNVKKHTKKSIDKLVADVQV